MTPGSSSVELQACSSCGMKVPPPVELHHSESDCLAEQKRQREGKEALAAVHEAHARLEAEGRLEPRPRLCDPAEQEARREAQRQQLRRACEGCTHALGDHLTHREHPDDPHPCTVDGCTCNDFVPEDAAGTAGDRVEDLAAIRSAIVAEAQEVARGVPAAASDIASSLVGLVRELQGILELVAGDRFRIEIIDTEASP